MIDTLVSIVMPAYNRERLIEAAIASVLSQEKVGLEIIVVDDGSTDRTADIVRSVASDDARTVLIQTQRGGPAAARNRGVADAKGAYLCFVDSDDICPPGRVARQVAKLTKRPDVTAVVGALLAFEDIDDAGYPCWDRRHRPYHNAALHTAMFRTADFRRFGSLDETLEFAEDVDFFLRLLEADVKLLLEPEIASFYRLHPGNMTWDIRGRQCGHAKAYARSIARRRAARKTTPLDRFFPAIYSVETEFGGSAVRSDPRLHSDSL